MSFGVIFCVTKYKHSIESAQSFYFGFYKKDGCNIFSFLEKKRRNKIIQSIRNVNPYPNKSYGQVFDLSEVFFFSVNITDCIF